MKESPIKEVKDIFVPCANTDKMEGSGDSYYLGYCEYESTAKRLAKGQGSMGCDCEIYNKKSYKIDGVWYAPIIFIKITSEDEREERTRKNNEIAAQNKAKVLKKAKELGLSEEDIKILNG